MLIIEDKIYKFDCGNEERKNEWINAINNELKKIKGRIERKVENVYQVKLRKKLIQDPFKFPNVTCDLNDIQSKANDIMSKEPEFFKDKKKKVETKKEGTSLGISLDFGLLSEEKKSSGIFSCCRKILTIFKKKETYNEFEEK